MDPCIAGFEKIFEHSKVELVTLFVVTLSTKVTNFICHIFNTSD